jgi:glycosyltransferase involved in cell wall biosynthesis
VPNGKLTPNTQSLRILCISPLFAPSADSEAFCSTKMIRALVDCGVDVSVLASESIRSKDRAFDDSQLWAFATDIASEVPLPTMQQRMYSLLAAVKYQTSFYSRWVDVCVKQAERLHRSHRFDLVYSRSLPMIAHVAAYWCARAFKVPWIANINDPWEFHFLPDIQYPRTSRFESEIYLFWLRRTLRKASLITYPCQGLWKFHVGLAGMDHPATVIPHIGSSWKKRPASNPSVFNLVHAGKLGAFDITGRSGYPLLLALRRFLDNTPTAAGQTLLTLVGPEDKQIQEWSDKLGLQSNIRVVGRVNYERSLQSIADASICVLVEANLPEGIFFPSKLADYLVSGKPVLALSPRKGVVASMADQEAIVRVDPDDPCMIQRALSDLYWDFRHGSLQRRAPHQELSNQFRSDAVARQFLKIAHRILHLRDRDVSRSFENEIGSPANTPSI